MTDPKKISIILPVFNEEAGIVEFYTQLKAAIHPLSFEWELIFVNDGSEDGTQSLLEKIKKENSQVKVITFTRNFGHQNALLAGLEVAQGDAVITMDTDLQHPPQMIPSMIEEWKKGFEVVQGVKNRDLHSSLFKRMTSLIFYRLFGFISESSLPPNSSDFRLLSKRVAEFMIQMEEQSFFLRGLVHWAQFPTSYLPYDVSPRFAGKTHYSISKMFKLGLDAIFSFSIKPIRMSMWLSVVTFIVALAYLGYALYMKLALQQAVPGWTSTLILITFFQGIQFLMIGIIGEYLGRVYTETKRRPRYVILKKM